MKLQLLLKKMVLSKFFVMGMLGVIIISCLCFFYDSFMPFDPTLADYSVMLKGPEWFANGFNGHVLGTDALGRDVLTRLLKGGIYSLKLAFIAVGVAAFIGCVLGTFAGYYGKWLDMLIMRTADIQLTIPSLMLAIALVAILGPNEKNLIIVLIISGWAKFARIIRGNVMALRHTEFISASRVLGASNLWIMFKQIFPNVLTPTIIFASQQLGYVILVEASLSYLGLGIQPPNPSWGVMIANGKDYLQTAPWIVLAPGFTLSLAVLSFNFLGDGIRDVLDPKMK